EERGGFVDEQGGLVSKLRGFFDSVGDQIVIAKERIVITHRLQSRNLPSEPLLLAKLIDPAFAALGKSTQIRIERADPKMQLSILSGPEGLTTNEAGLTFAPKPEQAGVHKVRLLLKQGEAERVVDIDLTVERPYVALDFVPNAFELSNDAALAV